MSDTNRKNSTRNDVARLANVAPSTVSHVINGTKFVGEPIKERVLEAIRQLNYEPNLVAKSLRMQSTKHVAVFINDLYNTFYADICSGAISEGEKEGYLVDICIVGDSDINYYNEMYLRQVNGIINFSQVFCSDETYKKLSSKVAMVNCLPFAKQSVGINYTHAMEKIASLFYARGRKKIAMITGTDWESIVHDTRYVGLKYYCERLGIPLDERLILNGKNQSYRNIFNNGYEGMKKLLELDGEIDGVFCINDMLAIGAAAYLRSVGKKIPDDISICGCDNISYIEYLENKISTIDFDKNKFGRFCMRNIFSQIKGEQGGEEKIIYAEFIDNGSI